MVPFSAQFLDVFLEFDDLIREIADAAEGFRPIPSERFDQLRRAYRDVLERAVKVAGAGNVGPGITSFDRHLSTLIALPHQSGGRTQLVAYKQARGHYYTGLRAYPTRPRLLAEWVLLAPVADLVGTDRAMEWGIETWVAREAESTPKLLRTMLIHTDRLLATKDPLEFVRELLAEQSVRELIGFNVHAEVAYYHVESLEGLLWALYSAAFVRLLASSPMGGRTVQSAVIDLFRTIRVIADGAERAHGRQDELLRNLNQSVRQSSSAGGPVDADRSESCESAEATEDPECSPERVACFGSCALAPVMVVDGKVHGRMTADKAVSLVEDIA